METVSEFDGYLTAIIKEMGAFGEPLKPLQQQVACEIKKAGALETRFPLRGLLKECAAALHAQEKELLADGESLDKGAAKKFAESQGYNSWQQYKKQLNFLVEQITGGITDEQSFIECHIKSVRQIIKEAHWLTEKFGAGQYADILGLCKVATRKNIEEKNWSLTPGAYVGVAPVIDEDEENFAERMMDIHKELLSLQAESNNLMETITANFEGLDI